MGLVVTDVVWRIRQRTGWVHAHEWDAFLETLGVDVFRWDLPETIPAFFHGDCIYIAQRIDPLAAQRYIWHEIGHAVLHAGGPAWWIARPQGYLTVARFERQADEFARLFPVWDDAEMWGGVWG